ncbi:uncharacterized protein CLUP02_17973 [Colletotrichum lupini]|uniref:Uncharacterized protein n=1 Tax=Colletotrichum lupini TaxID=145971 RepID=A0A9Q8WBF2_9PEZI|nr:uncharacterized protein CLUP02_17973 [Colletotrichum lupini]UQC76460.1 hypothetical protein CLUP02_17973 [Colletotrichum lupini]
MPGLYRAKRSWLLRLNLKLLYTIPSIQRESAHPLPVFGFNLKGWSKIQRPVHVTWQTASSGNAPLESPCAPVKATPPVLTIPAFLYIYISTELDHHYVRTGLVLHKLLYYATRVQTLSLRTTTYTAILPRPPAELFPS